MDIEWKSNDRIVVTVDVNKDLENYEEVGWMEEDDEIMYDDDDDDVIIMEEEDAILDAIIGDEKEVFDEGGNDNTMLGLIASTINELLSQDGEGSPAFQIAKLHQIEVTTPVFDNVLRGEIMFQNYAGFDVLVEHWEEPKKKKKKNSKAQKTNGNSEDGSKEEEDDAVVVAVEAKAVEVEEQKKLTISEGKLVGRDYEKNVTMISIKGRVVKIKNELIECVSLPKAKKEKGAK